MAIKIKEIVISVLDLNLSLLNPEGRIVRMLVTEFTANINPIWKPDRLIFIK